MAREPFPPDKLPSEIPVDVLISPKKVMECGIAASVALAVALGLLYVARVVLQLGSLEFVADVSTVMMIFLLLGLFILLIPVHELLHGLGFWWFGRSKAKYGFDLKMMAPYAMSLSPMPINAYRWSVALPNLVLGALPILIGLIWMQFYVFLLGIIMLSGGVGDAAILLALRKFPATAFAQDLPTAPGCRVWGLRPFHSPDVSA